MSTRPKKQAEPRAGVSARGGAGGGALDLSKTSVLNLTVEGVRVRVHVDANGRPLTASTGYWVSDDAERIAKLAIAHVCERLERVASRPKGKRPGSVTKALKALLEKNSEAKAHDARKYLNEHVPGHGLNPRSVTSALSREKAKKKKLADS